MMSVIALEFGLLFIVFVNAVSVNHIAKNNSSSQAPSIVSSVRLHSVEKKLCEHGGHFIPSRRSKLSTQCIATENCQCVEENAFNHPTLKNSSDCHGLTATIYFENTTHIKLANLLHQADELVSVRKIIIHIRKSSSSKYFHSVNYIRSIGALVDEYLTPRPWWKVVKEPFDWTVLPVSEHSSTLTVVLDRYLYSWEDHFRYLVSVQFPPKEVCSRSPILVGKNSCIHPGWFSVLAFYTITHRQFPFAISTTYVPYLEDVEHQQSAFITLTNPNTTKVQRDCPAYNHSDMTGHYSNSWLCAFLPATNCTLPHKVTSCKNSGCILEQNTGFSLYLDSANSSGQVINASLLEMFGKTAQSAAQTKYAQHQTPPPFLFTLPYNLTYAQNYERDRKRCMFSHVGSESAAFMYAFLLRKSAFYRSRVAKVIHSFRMENRFNASTSCVAVHLRRGDRVMRVPADVNFEEYCYNATHNLPCVNGHCDPDAGCGEDPRQPPFAAITLQHVLDKVPLLVGPGIRTIFVASDDSPWVEQQIKLVERTDPHWNIITLPKPTKQQKHSNNNGSDSHSSSSDPHLGDTEPYAGYFYMRSQGGSASGIYLMASMELSTQCEGFIGHMGCGGTMLHYQYMCMAHAGKKGICPPIYDLRNGLFL